MHCRQLPRYCFWSPMCVNLWFCYDLTSLHPVSHIMQSANCVTTVKCQGRTSPKIDLDA